MTHRLKFRLFAHSWVSDWNHGNAHFLRGLTRELCRQGHEVRCYEDQNSWSRTNLLAEGLAISQAAFQQFQSSFPELDIRFFQLDETLGHFLDEELRGADVVLVHEWNSPALVNAILARKRKYEFRALFHDTHHRAYTSPKEILAMDLPRFDGVLAFGEAIRRIYREGFGIQRVWTFHEAADTAHFFPSRAERDTDVVWVGNWGDDERTRELEEFLIRPVEGLGLNVAVYGVRYPSHAKQRLAQAGIQYQGYLPNLEAPRTYSKSKLTLHVPRRFYANGLSGVPTIRVFETLACGIPLLCSPWNDSEGLFRAGEDYLCLADGDSMKSEIAHLLRDDGARSQIAECGLHSIRTRHTCAHRAEQLLDICEELER